MNVSTLSLLPIWADDSAVIGAGTSRPLGFTRDELSEILLRAKRFAFVAPSASGAGTVEHIDTSVDGWSFSASGGSGDSVYSDDWGWQDERGQVGAKSMSAASDLVEVEVNGYAVTGTHPSTADAASAVGISILADVNNPIVLQGGLYWPAMTIYAYADAPAFSSCVVQSDWPTVPPGSSAISANASAFGKSIELRGYFTLTSGDYTGSATIASGASISIAEWRSYDGRWNTSTGARIGNWAG